MGYIGLWLVEVSRGWECDEMNVGVIIICGSIIINWSSAAVVN